MTLVEWILSAAGSLILFLLGAEWFGMKGLSEKFDRLSQSVKGEMAELKLCMTANYALKDENRDAHKEIWSEVNKTREDVSRIQGKMNGD